MSVAENLRIVDQWMDAYNAHNFEAFAKPFTESANYYAPDRVEPLKGREEIREHFAQHPLSFPDARAEIGRRFGQGDVVCVEFTWIATNRGPLPGPGGETIPATNKALRLPIVAVLQFDEGEIAEGREYWDRVSFNAQLGLSP